MPTAWNVLLDEASRRLSESGVDSPRVDAEFLAAHVAKVTRGQLITASDPEPARAREYRQLVSRRARREPLQHILASAPFRYGELAVGAGVFVPRPETELLVEWALPRLAEFDEPLVVDLCAGAGSIGHAVIHECPKATVYLVEAHPEPLRWLRRNVTGTRAGIVEGDATGAQTLADLDGRCDAVLSNPPYVPADTPVSPEVAADPHSAVFAGADGLDVIRPLVERAARLLRPGGIVAIEHDASHGAAVCELLRMAGFSDVTDHPDLAERMRFATGRWR